MMDLFKTYESILEKFVHFADIRQLEKMHRLEIAEEGKEAWQETREENKAIFPAIPKIILLYQGIDLKDGVEYDFPFSQDLVQKALEAYTYLRKEFTDGLIN